MARTSIDPDQRDFSKRIIRDSETGCWIWNGQLKNGYPFAWHRGRHAMSIRRIMFNHMRRRLRKPELLEDERIRNTCDSGRLCVNPDHMVVLTYEK